MRAKVRSFVWAFVLVCSPLAHGDDEAGERRPGWEAARLQLVEGLMSCRTVEELRAHRGPHGGMFLDLPGGRWIAFSYMDSHFKPDDYSCCVALASDGTWLASDFHFCGAIGGYSETKRRVIDTLGKNADATSIREAFRSRGPLTGMMWLAFYDAEVATSMQDSFTALQRLRFEVTQGPAWSSREE